MDYSAIAHDDGGFGDDHSPFANPHAQPHDAHAGVSGLASPTLVASSTTTQHDSDEDGERGVRSPPFQPYAAAGGFGALVDDDGGFRSPTFAPSIGSGVGVIGSPPLQPEQEGFAQQPQQQQQEGQETDPPLQQEQQQQQQQQQQQGQTEHQRPQRYHQHPQQQQRPPQYYLTAKVTGLERTGRKDPILRFDVHTNLPKFRTTQFRDVRRTHPEFQKFAHHLLSSNPECIVPAVPPPSTSAGVGTDEDETRVRAMMQRWLNTVCSNDVLIRDEETLFFVEADFGYSPVVRRKQPATGVRRKMIKQFAPPPDDTPELETARPIVKAFYLGTMETGQRLDRVVKARRGLGLAESDLGTRLQTIAANEAHPGMSNAFRKLGRTIQSVGDFHAAQATAEATTLADPLNYHSSDAFIVKETLTNRQILMRDLATARKDTASKLQTAEVLKGKGSIRRDKVDEAIQALDEAKSTEAGLESKVRRVTANLVQERRKWFARTAADMRAAIRDHTLRQIEAERRTLATLEMVRPDVRAIDASGGLSRLGRDAPPSSRRASLAASQGPRGDAWSGVARAQAGIRRDEFTGVHTVGGLKPKRKVEEGIAEEAPEEGERLDAKNAAGALAGSTF